MSELTKARLDLLRELGMPLVEPIIDLLDTIDARDKRIVELETEIKRARMEGFQQAIDEVGIMVKNLLELGYKKEQILTDIRSLAPDKHWRKRIELEAKRELFRCLKPYINAPNPSHDGPCGPESGCDAGCMDAAYFAEFIAALDAPKGVADDK